MAPVNPGAYVEYAAPGAADKETKLWVDAADRAGGFGIAVGASEYSKAVKQADDLQFNMLVAEAEDVQRRLTYDKDEGYLNKRGENAMPDQDGVSLTEKYRDTRKRAVDAIAAKAKNDRVRRRFEKWNLDAGSKFDDMTSRHTYDQYVNLQSKVFGQRLDGKVSEAVTLASEGNLDGALEMIAEAKQVADEVAAFAGTKPDYQKLVGPGFAAVIEAAMDAGINRDVIKGLWKGNQDLVAPELRDKTRDGIEKYWADSYVEDMAVAIVTKHKKDRAGALKEALAGTGVIEKYQAPVRTRVNQLIAAAEQADRQTEMQVRDNCLTWMVEHPGQVAPRAMARGASPDFQLTLARMRLRGVGGGGDGEGGDGGGGSVSFKGGDGQTLTLSKGERRRLKKQIEFLGNSTDENERLLYAKIVSEGKLSGFGGRYAPLNGKDIAEVLGLDAAQDFRNKPRTQGGMNEQAIQAVQKEALDFVSDMYPNATNAEKRAIAADIAETARERDKAAGVGKPLKDGRTPVSQFVGSGAREAFIKERLTTVTEEGWFGGKLGGKTYTAVDIDRENRKYAREKNSASKEVRNGANAPEHKIADYGDWVNLGLYSAVRAGKDAPAGSTNLADKRNRIVFEYYQKKMGAGLTAGQIEEGLTDEQKKVLGSIRMGTPDPVLSKQAAARLIAAYNRENPKDAGNYHPGVETVELEMMRHAFDETRKPKTNKKPAAADDTTFFFGT